MDINLKLPWMALHIHIPSKGADLVDMEHIALTTAHHVVDSAMHDMFCEPHSDEYE